MADLSQVRVGDTLYNIKDATARMAMGAPSVAATASAMIDQGRVYVYTGSESGYTKGNWYYYNGSSWVSGGVYNSAAVETDTSLSVSGSPADAKVTGDYIKDMIAVGQTAPSEYTQVLLSDTTSEVDLVTTSEFNSEISDLKSAIQQGGGFNTQVKTLIESLFRKVSMWSADDAEETIDALHSAMFPPANLVSISAVYTQSGAVYENDSLDSLKSDLVVTAHYDNSTSGVVTAYTLSGTLTEGTSVITVMYGGKSTTFNVTVSSTPIEAYYSLPSAQTFTGSNAYNTGVKICSLINEGDASLFIDFTDAGTANASDTRVLWAIGAYGNNYNGIHVSGGTSNNGKYNFVPLTANNFNALKTSASYKSGDRIKMLFVWKQEDSLYKWKVYTVINGDFAGSYAGSSETFTVGLDNPLVLGAANSNAAATAFTAGSYWTGTVNSLNVYDVALTESEACAMLGIQNECVYALPVDSVFDGVDDYVDTNFAPFIYHDATLLIDFTPNTQIYTSGANTIGNLFGAGGNTAVPLSYVDILNNGYYRLYPAISGGLDQCYPFTANVRTKIAIKQDTLNKKWTYKFVSEGSEVVSGQKTYTLSGNNNTPSSENLIVGAIYSSGSPYRFFKGTIHSFEIYASALSDSEIAEFIGG